MKKTLYCLVFIIVTSAPFFCHAQTLGTKERKIIYQKIDSLLDIYSKCARFTKDFETLNEGYINLFRQLFQTDSTFIFNDLNPDPQPPFYLSIDDYIKYLRQWYPSGLSSVNLQQMPMEEPLERGSNYIMKIKVQKSFLGFSMKTSDSYSKTIPMTIEIVFNKKIENFKISAINHDDYIREQTPNQYEILIARADSLFFQKKYHEAKVYFQSAAKIKQNDFLSSQRIAKCDEFIQESDMPAKKTEDKGFRPFFLNMHIVTGSTIIKITGDGILPSSSAQFASGGGIGVEKVITKGKKGDLRFGLSIDFMNYKSKYAIDRYYGTKLTLDRVNQQVLVMNTLTNVQESIKLSFFEIPLFISYKFNVASHVFIFAQAGFSFGFITGKVYESSATGDYEGEYAVYNGFIFTEKYRTAFRSYGYGIYNVSVKNSTPENLSIFNFSGLGEIGAGFSPGKKTDLYLGIKLSRGFVNLSGSNPDFILSTHNTELQSMTGMGSAKTHAIGLEFGMNFRLF